MKTSMSVNGKRIEARGLKIGYKNESIIAGIEMCLDSGQAMALVGVNGSGKSTLLKTIVGLLSPLDGEMAVLGARPGTTPRRIAYLSQFHSTGFILPLRVVDIVGMGRYPEHGLFGKLDHDDRAMVQDAMNRMGIASLSEFSLRDLSGGQQQRVYLAQVLAHHADLLVLDEPTSGLDANGKELYQTAMRQELERGASLVVATHDIREAAECDQVMLLSRRVVALGSPSQVLTPDILLETFGITILQKDACLQVAVLEHEHDPCADHGDRHAHP
jgi:ABC-type Mn2+/Zn2+ transport system ATPase subunit